MKARFDPAIHDENPELTDDMLARMRPAREVLGDKVVDALAARRGRPKLDRPKEAVKLRLDADILDHYRASGPGWQTRINAALARDVAAKDRKRT